MIEYGLDVKNSMMLFRVVMCCLIDSYICYGGMCHISLPSPPGYGGDTFFQNIHKHLQDWGITYRTLAEESCLGKLLNVVQLS